MKHVTLAIGLILIIAGSVLLVVDETTYGLVSSYTYSVDFTFSLSVPLQSYNNQTYVMNALSEFIQAHEWDKIVITTKLTSNNSGNWPVVFIQPYDLRFIYENESLQDYSTFVNTTLTYSAKEFPVYSAVVGQDTALSNFDTYVIRFGVISTFNPNDDTALKIARLSDLGTYIATINVYSKGSNSLFLTLGVLLLTDGVVISVVAYVSANKPKEQRLPANQTDQEYSFP